MAGVTKSANIQTKAREIDFVSSFQKRVKALIDLLGVSNAIKVPAGAQLKKKRAYGKLENGIVAEGENIPYSEYYVKEFPFKPLVVEEYSKQVSLKAIMEKGYDNAVLATDEEFKFDLQKKLCSDFYGYLKEGLLGAGYDTFQMALAMAKGLVEDKFAAMKRSATGTIGFANIMDASQFLGASNVTIQNQYGFQYIKDFLGYNTIFLLSKNECPRGKVFATAIENLVPYYVDPSDSDFIKAGLEYTTDGEVPMIGFHTEGNYGKAASDEFAIMGAAITADYQDAIAVVTFGGPEVSAAAGTGDNFDGLGKAAEDLQSGIVIGDTDFAGTLKYVTGYTGFSGETAEQEGNYLALVFTTETGATTKIGWVDSDRTATLVEGGRAVIRVTSPEQYLKVTSTKAGKVTERIFSLAGLTLEPKAE